jgi:hypothetical protein
VVFPGCILPAAAVRPPLCGKIEQFSEEGYLAAKDANFSSLI